MWLKTTKPWDTFFITTFVRSYLPGIYPHGIIINFLMLIYP